MKKCKFCYSNNTFCCKIIKSPHYELSYSLFECIDCKSRFFDHKEHKISLDGLYEKLAKSPLFSNLTQDDITKKNLIWKIQKDKIVKLPGTSPKSILDAGCESSGFLTYFNTY